MLESKQEVKKNVVSLVKMEETRYISPNNSFTPPHVSHHIQWKLGFAQMYIKKAAN